MHQDLIEIQRQFEDSLKVKQNQIKRYPKNLKIFFQGQKNYIKNKNNQKNHKIIYDKFVEQNSKQKGIKKSQNKIDRQFKTVPDQVFSKNIQPIIYNIKNNIESENVKLVKQQILQKPYQIGFKNQSNSQDRNSFSQYLKHQIQQKKDEMKKFELISNLKNVVNPNKYPFTAIGRIISSFYQINKLGQLQPYKQIYGTGFLIYSNIVLTSAHCVFDRNTKQIARQVTFIQRLGTSLIFNEQTNQKYYQIQTLYIPNQYKHQNQEQSNKWNIAILIIKQQNLNKTLNDDKGKLNKKSNYLNHDFLGYYTNWNDLSDQIYISGYPFDSQNNKTKQIKRPMQICSSGKIQQINNELLYYRIQTTVGQSGSPILRKTENGFYQVIGIHNKKFQRIQNNQQISFQNCGIKFTESIRRWINQKIGQNTFHLNLSRDSSQNFLQQQIDDCDIQSIVKTTIGQRITFLDLSNNNITQKGIQALTKKTEINLLKHLNLKFNQIGDIGLQLLSKVEFYQLLYLNIGLNGISEKGMWSFGQRFTNFKKLQHLNLQQNQFGQEGVKNITIDKSSFSNLTYLNLSSNNIGDMGVRHLIIKKKIFPLMNTLLLKQNNIGDQSLKYFLKTKSNDIWTNMRNIDLSHNNFSVSSIQQIIKCLFMICQNLQKLQIETKKASSSFISKTIQQSKLVKLNNCVFSQDSYMKSSSCQEKSNITNTKQYKDSRQQQKKIITMKKGKIKIKSIRSENQYYEPKVKSPQKKLYIKQQQIKEDNRSQEQHVQIEEFKRKINQQKEQQRQDESPQHSQIFNLKQQMKMQLTTKGGNSKNYLKSLSNTSGGNSKNYLYSLPSNSSLFQSIQKYKNDIQQRSKVQQMYSAGEQSKIRKQTFKQQQTFIRKLKKTNKRQVKSFIVLLQEQSQGQEKQKNNFKNLAYVIKNQKQQLQQFNGIETQTCVAKLDYQIQEVEDEINYFLWKHFEYVYSNMWYCLKNNPRVTQITDQFRQKVEYKQTLKKKKQNLQKKKLQIKQEKIQKGSTNDNSGT